MCPRARANPLLAIITKADFFESHSDSAAGARTHAAAVMLAAGHMTIVIGSSDPPTDSQRERASRIPMTGSILPQKNAEYCSARSAGPA